MKALKALVFFLFFCVNSSTFYAQECTNKSQIALQSYYPIKTKDASGSTSEGGVPIKRSIQLDPAYAYIYNNTVSINFTETFSTVNIRIIDETSGSTVHSEIYNNPACLNIDLNGDRSGNYLIEIEAEDLFLGGHFTL